MVSIVLCTYNDSHLLANGLKSCISQPVQREIIVVDDCSTEPLCPEILDVLEMNGDIRLIRHDTNLGLSAARNTGIAHAKYNLVIPLDADDYFLPDVIRKMVEQFDDNTDVVYGNLWTAGMIDSPCAQPFTKALLQRRNPIFCSSMFRKSLWQRVGGYLVREGPHYEDWHFWNKCYMAKARFKYIDQVIYEHVERGDSMLRKLGEDKEKYATIATAPLREGVSNTKLHLGCGPIHIEGFTNVDIVDGPGVDVVDDVKILDSFPPRSVSTIYACHVLEHFSHDEIPGILRRWRDVLIPGGELRISVPDIDRIVKVYSKNWEHFQTPGNSPWVGLLYGGEGSQYDYHKTGFNFCWLKFLMENEGFKNIEEYPHDPHWLGVVDASLANAPFGEYLSLNVKATK